MPIRSLLACIFILGFLSGCDSSFTYKEKISGKYYLVAVDSMDQLALREEQPDGNFMGVIPSRVISIGQNKEYIVAVQRSKHQDFRYYILNLTTHELNGPLTKEEFDAARNEVEKAGRVSLKIIE